MSDLQISLFGQFRIRRDGRDLDGFDVHKVQELLSYLLLHAGRPQVRELGASRLWGGHCTTSRSKAYLRKVLWRLQSALRTEAGAGAEDLITASGDSICLHRVSSVKLDVAVFEEAYADARGIPGHGLSTQSVHALKRAVRLYSGDLLAIWHFRTTDCRKLAGANHRGRNVSPAGGCTALHLPDVDYVSERRGGGISELSTFVYRVLPPTNSSQVDGTGAVW